jgi:hypothetical protein
MLQSPPVASQLAVPHAIMLANALPSALHFIKVLSLHANLPASQTTLVHMPKTSLHKAALVQVLFAVKLLPSAAHTSSEVPVQRYSVLARHVGQLRSAMPA